MYSLFWLSALKCYDIPDLYFFFPEVESIQRIQRTWRRYKQYMQIIMGKLEALLRTKFHCDTVETKTFRIERWPYDLVGAHVAVQTLLDGEIHWHHGIYVGMGKDIDERLNDGAYIVSKCGDTVIREELYKFSNNSHTLTRIIYPTFRQLTAQMTANLFIEYRSLLRQTSFDDCESFATYCSTGFKSKTNIRQCLQLESEQLQREL